VSRRAVLVAIAGLALAAGAAGLRLRWQREPTPGPQTYEQIERALTGRWRMTTPWTDAGGFYTARELIFGPNRVWVTPSFRDYGGHYYLEGTDTIRVRHEPSSTEALWQFRVEGDTLTLWADGVTVHYARVKPASPSG
jgi:hypothetical protein